MPLIRVTRILKHGHLEVEDWDVDLNTHHRVSRSICKEEEKLMTLIDNLKLNIPKKQAIQKAIGEFGDLLTDTDIRFAEAK